MKNDEVSHQQEENQQEIDISSETYYHDDGSNSRLRNDVSIQGCNDD